MDRLGRLMLWVVLPLMFLILIRITSLSTLTQTCPPTSHGAHMAN